MSAADKEFMYEGSAWRKINGPYNVGRVARLTRDFGGLVLKYVSNCRGADPNWETQEYFVSSPTKEGQFLADFDYLGPAPRKE